MESIISELEQNPRIEQIMDIKEDLRRWFKEKWTSQSGEECGSYS